jgi:hypothetical protein
MNYSETDIRAAFDSIAVRDGAEERIQDALLQAQPVPRHQFAGRRVAIAGSAAAVAAVSALAVTIGPADLFGDHSPADPRTQSAIPQIHRAGDGYPLWSDGWRPGDPALLALTEGRFHAAVVDGHACAWLGDMRPMKWPAGWTVSFGPQAVLRDADGQIVAHEGDNLSVGGAATEIAKASDPCGPAGKAIWSVMSGISQQ